MPIDDNELNSLTGIQLNTPVAPVCPQCHYNLTGLRDPVCPECGYRFDWKTVRRKARTQWLEALGLKTLPEEIQFGFTMTWIAWAMAVVVTGGVVLRIASGVMSPTLSTLFLTLKVIGILMAFCGLFLCSHIIKFQQLSEDVREALRIEVPVAKAWVGLVASGVLLPISVLTLCLV